MSYEASNNEVQAHVTPPGTVPPPFGAGFGRLPKHIRTHTIDYLDKEIAQARRERKNLSADSFTFANRRGSSTTRSLALSHSGKRSSDVTSRV